MNTAAPGNALGKRRFDKRQAWAFAFCLPNILFFLIFFVAPAIVGIGYSLTNYNGFKRMDFVGLSNYITLFTDGDFYKTMWQTICYSLVSVPLGYAAALGLGLLLSSERLKGITLLRILVYWPVLLSTIMVGLTWRWIFGENFGLINYLLQCAGLPPVKWATDSTAAFMTTVIAGVWSGCGTNILIFIGALKQISTELVEAATLDGANSWQIFRNITLPHLKPVSFMVIILLVINSFKVFAMVQTLTNGGPGTATTYMIQYIYTTGFTRNKVGYASAASMVLFVILLILSFVQTKISDRRDD